MKKTKQNGKIKRWNCWRVSIKKTEKIFPRMLKSKWGCNRLYHAPDRDSVDLTHLPKILFWTQRESHICYNELMLAGFGDCDIAKFVMNFYPMPTQYWMSKRQCVAVSLVSEPVACPVTSLKRNAETSSMFSSKSWAPCCRATPARWTSPLYCRRASIFCTNTKVKNKQTLFLPKSDLNLDQSCGGVVVWPVSLPRFMFFLYQKSLLSLSQPRSDKTGNLLFLVMKSSLSWCWRWAGSSGVKCGVSYLSHAIL